MSARLERRGRQLSKLTLTSPIGSCVAMSALGPKRTFLFAPQISAFGDKADMAFCASSAAGGWPVNGAPPFSLPDAGDSTAVRLSAPGAVRHDVAHQVVHVVLQISDDVLDDVSDRDHAHDLA